MEHCCIEKRLKGERQLTIRVIAMPADANAYGDIFGGWLMSQVDMGGSIIACQIARGRVVTVAVNDFRFLQPVLVGDLVSCYSKIARTGRTSITVESEVFAERDPSQITESPVARATLTYVAVDDEGRPRELPGESR